MDNKRNLELLYEIGAFRHIRRLWERFLNPDFQNNTEHAFRVAWIALALAKQEGVGDHEKILKMALAHDLPESRCGDVDYVARLYTDRNEEKAIVDIFAGTAFEDEIPEIWREFEARESIEARIVKDADNLDVEFELQEQGARGHSIKDIWKETREKGVYPKLFTESAKQMWRDIHAETTSPNDWHLLGRNRFKDGDWNSRPLG